MGEMPTEQKEEEEAKKTTTTTNEADPILSLSPVLPFAHTLPGLNGMLWVHSFGWWENGEFPMKTYGTKTLLINRCVVCKNTNFIYGRDFAVVYNGITKNICGKCARNGTSKFFVWKLDAVWSGERAGAGQTWKTKDHGKMCASMVFAAEPNGAGNEWRMPPPPASHQNEFLPPKIFAIHGFFVGLGLKCSFFHLSKRNTVNVWKCSAASEWTGNLTKIVLLSPSDVISKCLLLFKYFFAICQQTLSEWIRTSSSSSLLILPFVSFFFHLASGGKMTKRRESFLEKEKPNIFLRAIRAKLLMKNAWMAGWRVCGGLAAVH